MAAVDTQVYFWRKGHPLQNFGDYLSAFFLARLFYGPSYFRARLHLIGSVISDHYVQSPEGGRNTEKVVFWGCGLRGSGSLSAALRSETEFLAVRGPLTKAFLGLSASTAMGDPGLLLPALYQPKMSDEHRGKSICVPHFDEVRSDQELLKMSGCRIVVRPTIPPSLAAIERVIDAITSADFTLTASLHAAVIAAAYGKKFAFWDPGKIDVPFKWRDFSESIALSKVVHLASVDDAIPFYEQEIHPKIRIPPLWPLLAVAPFPVLPNVLARVLYADLQRHGEGVLDEAIDLRTKERLLDQASRLHLTKREVHASSIANVFKRANAWLASTTKTWRRGVRLRSESLPKKVLF
jgi:hypothetical protein